ncbi:MAG: hypothetical protein VXV96_12130 [Bdellovibrionota bacterium]|nr:hypothetical protein [Bdellovibrionota bacterium]
MGLIVGHLNLYSRNPTELAQFFSELLDMDLYPDASGDGIWVSSDTIKFFVTQANADQLFNKASERDLMVEFTLPSLSDLEDLLHKVQFMSYRKSAEELKPKARGHKIQLSKVANKVFFHLKDPDGRRWKFSFDEEL